MKNESPKCLQCGRILIRGACVTTDCILKDIVQEGEDRQETNDYRRARIVTLATEAARNVICTLTDGSVEESDYFHSAVMLKLAEVVHGHDASRLLHRDIGGRDDLYRDSYCTPEAIRKSEEQLARMEETLPILQPSSAKTEVQKSIVWLRQTLELRKAQGRRKYEGQ